MFPAFELLQEGGIHCPLCCHLLALSAVGVCKGSLAVCCSTSWLCCYLYQDNSSPREAGSAALVVLQTLRSDGGSFVQGSCVSANARAWDLNVGLPFP